MTVPGKYSFQIRWLKDADYMVWVLPVLTDKDSARCIYCGIDIWLHWMGESILLITKGLPVTRNRHWDSSQIPSVRLPILSFPLDINLPWKKILGQIYLHTEEASKKAVPLVSAASDATFPAKHTGKVFFNFLKLF